MRTIEGRLQVKRGRGREENRQKDCPILVDLVLVGGSIHVYVGNYYDLSVPPMSVMDVNNGSEETIGDLSHIFIGSRIVHNTRSTYNELICRTWIISGNGRRVARYRVPV